MISAIQKTLLRRLRSISRNSAYPSVVRIAFILIGGGGSDVFILGAGEGESIITDFESGDVIGLAGGLGAGSLYSVQDGGNTVIGTFSGDLLAVVLNTTVDQFVDSTFISA